MSSNKLGDVVVIRVHYGPGMWGRRIEKVQVSQALSRQPLVKSEYSRAEMLEFVRRFPKSCITSFVENGVWKPGAPIEIVKVGGVEYLRTDANQRNEDNLGNLPEF